jgi:hypothetical protein
MVEEQAEYQDTQVNGHSDELKAISIRLPRSWNKALRQYSLDHDTNMNEIIRGLVDGFLREHHLLK